MKDPLRKMLDSAEHHFVGDGRLKLFFPLFELVDTFLYTPGKTTARASHVRDALDLKRLMITVAAALIPCILMAMYNTGMQANLAIAAHGLPEALGWRLQVMQYAGLAFDGGNILANFVHGALYFVPVFLVCNIVGGLWEVLFSIVRRHEVNEGFLVTGILFPLTLPPTIPLWQVAIGISFGVVIGKEVFGGTGKNFLNPALTARAFLFFAYPAQISGDAVWTAVDGFTGATPLGIAAIEGFAGIQQAVTWWDAFLGAIPGSMGETSALACLFGAFVLIATGIGSWQIMLSMLLGGAAMATILQIVGSSTNLMFAIPFHWHFVIGSFAFGMVFMATDPVSAAMTPKGKYVYGCLIGVVAIMVRTLNPAYPEGVMLAILFGNVFAPVIDYGFIKASLRRREQRLATARQGGT